jgi:leucyl-tRNA synthetase
MEENKLYNFSEIEKKWQKKWEKDKVFEVSENSDKPKYYVLEMFPYPSGVGIHMGHAFNYTLGDIFSRFKIMNGFNVLHPMGYDSLGLPAENAAIKVGISPREYTEKSIENFKKQQRRLGISYDWSRTINTADSSYYKWDQFIFLKMFEKGLVYQKEASVNWCSNCNTIISNEQAQGGTCDRCSTRIEIKKMKQWFLKISDYSERLLKGHEILNWPEKTIAMQKNWIGKSFGTEIDFEIDGQKWPIFTTRPDTIFGVTFMVISAQHLRLNELVISEQRSAVDKFLKKVGSVSEKEMADLEKEGVFTGSYAINPATEEKVPVYAGNFVVADYGSGMVMAVPAHDQRDFEFAKKYGIKIKPVIEGKITDSRAFTDSGKMINSGEFNGLGNEQAKEKITSWLKKEGNARKTINYKLRDWSVARQRYWGTPIPLVHCKSCGVVPIPEKELPVKLPEKVKFGKGNPLETNSVWLKVKCPKCGEEARRDPNTLDTFVNSSWYFFRYCDPKNDKEIFSREKVEYWMPVDLYIGGAEHACMHLIYSRFYTFFLRDIGLTSLEEATPRLFHQGMINGSDGEKMSKSRGNGVEPLEMIEKYGVDVLRYFLVSMASPDKGFNWENKSISGSSRFLEKVFSILDRVKIGEDSENLSKKLNFSIKNITSQIENLDYRKSTIELKELFELIIKEKKISKKSFEKALKLLSPFCPHITEELWEKIGGKGVISLAKWPEVDKEIIKEKKSQENVSDKIAEYVLEIVKKVKEKQEVKIVYLYVLPFEISKVDSERLSKLVGKEVKVFAVNDSGKYDPENRAKKALPGKPSIFIE